VAVRWCFDNLIDEGDAGDDRVFINPGIVRRRIQIRCRGFNRSFEYDGLGDRMRVFLEELLPVWGRVQPGTGRESRRSGVEQGRFARSRRVEGPDAFSRV